MLTIWKTGGNSAQHNGITNNGLDTRQPINGKRCVSLVVTRGCSVPVLLIVFTCFGETLAERQKICCSICPVEGLYLGRNT